MRPPADRSRSPRPSTTRSRSQSWHQPRNNNTMDHSTANDHPNKANVMIPAHQQVREEGTAAKNDESPSHSLKDGDDEDSSPFTVVTYRKNRPSGIPVILKPTGTKSFWKVNPNSIANDILAVTQEKILSHRINKDGSLTVHLASLCSANKLLALHSIGSVEVTAHVPETYSKNLGKIKNVPLEYSNSALLEYLLDNGVTSVQRQIAYYRKEDGSIEEQPSESVLLVFRTDRPMPQRVFLGFTSHPVEEYFGSPVQCFKCQKYGHVAKYCRGPQRCKDTLLNSNGSQVTVTYLGTRQLMLVRNQPIS
ncbi:uncharacterized protein ISCGN_014429 [Ixodes scapularis]